MHLSGESLAAEWMGKLPFGPKGGLRGGAIWRGGSLKRGSVCKYKVSRERGLLYWPAGWLGGKVGTCPLTSPCLPKVRLLFVALSLNSGAETHFAIDPSVPG